MALSPPRVLSSPVILALIAMSVVIVHPGAHSWNDASRMATIQALVEHGTFAIDQTAFVGTGDKAFIEGRFYSDKPPFPSLLGAAVYAPLYHLGLSLSEGRSAAYYLITLLTMKAWLLVALWAFHRALGITGLDAWPRMLLTGGLALGSLVLPWTSVFNNHGLAASFVAIGFYAILEARHRENGRIPLAVAGLFFGLAAICDIPTGAIYVAFGFVVVASPKLRRHTAFFVLPGFLAIGPYVLINYEISGSVLPVQINSKFFEYAGSPWIGSGELSGIAANKPAFILGYAWGCLFGRNGFILYNPLLLIAVPLAVSEIYRRRPFWTEALAALSAAGVIFLYYVVMTNNEGGWSFSIRWFVPLLPLLYFFLYFYLYQFTRFRMMTFAAMAGVSVLVALIGTVDPWANKQRDEISLISNLKLAAYRLTYYVTEIR